MPKGNLSHSPKNSGFAKEHLRAFVDRVERLEEERSALGMR